VTQWPALRIAQWLDAAGLPEGQLDHAVALALAVSEGCDHYHHNSTSDPRQARSGLWAMRQDDVPGDDPVNLHDPAASAQAVVAQWREQGERWDWHPTHLSGAALTIEPMVAMMLARRKLRLPAPNVEHYGEHVARARQLSEAIRRAGEQRGP
jgi:hypothetical protein